MKKKPHTNQFKSFFKIVSLLLIIVTSIVIFTLYRSYNTIKWGMSECLVWQSNYLSTRFIISNNEQNEINTLVCDFSNKISTGKTSPLKGFTILRNFYKGPIFMALLKSSIKNQQAIFEKSHKIDYSSYNNIPAKFFDQVRLDKVAPDSYDRVKKILIARKLCETKTSNGYTIPETIEIFKKDISVNAFFKCLNIMKNATNGGKIATFTELSPVVELKKVLINL